MIRIRLRRNADQETVHGLRVSRTPRHELTAGVGAAVRRVSLCRVCMRQQHGASAADHGTQEWKGMKPIDIALARKIGKETGARRVIVFYERELPGGQLGFGYASWGQDRRLCDSTRKIADLMYDHAEERMGEVMIEEYERLSQAESEGP